MKRKLTKREFVLLVALAFVVVAIAPYVLAIQPMMTKDTLLTTQIAQAETQRIEVTAELAQAQAAITQLEEAQKIYETKKADIGTRMKSFDIHYMVQDLTKGGTISSLSIGEYQEEVQELFTGATVYKCAVSFTLEASFADMLAAADAISKRPDCRLTQLSEESISDETFQSVIAFELYAIEPKEVTAVEASAEEQTDAAASAAASATAAAGA